MENNNKKTLILSIVGILVLVIAVVGVSFAMYSFTGTGTKDNVITTGTVTMNFKEGANNFTVSNKYPMSDAKGVAQTDAKADFGVTATWGTAQMNIKYDLAVSDITAGATLTEDYVKIALLDGTGKVIVGNTKEGAATLASGVTIGSLKAIAAPNGLLTKYGLTGGTLTTSGQTDNYKVLAYVADNYKLPTATDTTGENATTDETKGTTQTKTTGSETFSFKITVKAVQA